jgi:molybdopterin molybdotransferase
MLFRGVALKPGMACAYAIRDGKLLCGLSGNPASSLTNFYVVALPALRALCGLREPLLPEIALTLTGGFSKPSPGDRVLRGRLDLTDGTARLRLTGGQSNGVLSSAIGCDALAVIPAGSGPIAPGTLLKGYLI